jgi:hypothetical protein
MGKAAKQRRTAARKANTQTDVAGFQAREAKRAAKAAATPAPNKKGIQILDDDNEPDPPRPSWLPWNVPTYRWNAYSDEQKKIIKDSIFKRGSKAFGTPEGQVNQYGLSAAQFKALPDEYKKALLGERINVKKPQLLKKKGNFKPGVNLVMIQKKDGTVKAFPCRKRILTDAEKKKGVTQTCRTRIPANIKAMVK